LQFWVSEWSASDVTDGTEWFRMRLLPPPWPGPPRQTGLFQALPSSSPSAGTSRRMASFECRVCSQCSFRRIGLFDLLDLLDLLEFEPGAAPTLPSAAPARRGGWSSPHSIDRTLANSRDSIAHPSLRLLLAKLRRRRTKDKMARAGSAIGRPRPGISRGRNRCLIRHVFYKTAPARSWPIVAARVAAGSTPRQGPELGPAARKSCLTSPLSYKTAAALRLVWRGRRAPRLIR
jgi:hypothetical protein